MSTIDTVTEILEEFCPGVDLDSCTTLIDDHILVSLTMVALIAELEESFDIEVPPVEIMPDNFNSTKAIAALVDRLADEDD